MGQTLKLEKAQQWRDALRNAGKSLVFTNGHFDLFHVGHLDYLEKARALGDALFVGLNGDASSARLKGTRTAACAGAGARPHAGGAGSS